MGAMGAIARAGLGIGAACWAACSGVAPDLRQAIATLPEPVELAAEDREALRTELQLARNQLALGDVDAAAGVAAAIVEADPTNGHARALLGAAWMQQALATEPPPLDLWRRAEIELARAAHLEPEDAEVAVLEARFYAADGHLTAAARAVERALAVHPDHVECLQLASAWRYELGEERAARGHLEPLVALEPDAPLAVYRLGACRVALADETAASRGDGVLQELAGAVELFEHYVTLVADDPHGYHAVAATALRAAGQAGEAAGSWVSRARSALDAGCERFPRRASLRFLDGLCREAEGDDAAAATAYTEALERDASHVGAALNLADVRTRLQDQDGARRALRQALAADMSRPQLTASQRRAIRAALDS